MTSDTPQKKTKEETPQQNEVLKVFLKNGNSENAPLKRGNTLTIRKHLKKSIV